MMVRVWFLLALVFLCGCEVDNSSSRTVSGDKKHPLEKKGTAWVYAPYAHAISFEGCHGSRFFDDYCYGEYKKAERALVARRHDDFELLDRWGSWGPVGHPDGDRAIMKWCVAYHPGGDWHECWETVEVLRPSYATTCDGSACKEFDAVIALREQEVKDYYQNGLSLATDNIGEIAADAIGDGYIDTEIEAVVDDALEVQ
jgi:hypothetical protein